MKIDCIIIWYDISSIDRIEKYIVIHVNNSSKQCLDGNMNIFTWIIFIYDFVFFNSINTRYIRPYNNAIDIH